MFLFLFASFLFSVPQKRVPTNWLTTETGDAFYQIDFNWFYRLRFLQSAGKWQRDILQHCDAWQHDQLPHLVSWWVSRRERTPMIWLNNLYFPKKCSNYFAKLSQRYGLLHLEKSPKNSAGKFISWGKIKIDCFRTIFKILLVEIK